MKVTKYGLFILITLLIFAFVGTAFAGQFGAPESTAKGVGNEWQVGIGYWYHQDVMKTDTKEYTLDQNQVYAQLGKSFSIAEVFVRVGGSSYSVSNAFADAYPQYPRTNADWDPGWKPFGTLGLKGYLPINKVFGVGGFVQGSYYFGDYDASSVLTVSGIPVTDTVKIKSVWDTYAGVALQATVADIKLYSGPYVYYWEGKGQESATVLGSTFTGNEMTVKNKTNFGGFLGVDIPFTKELHFSIEGQYSEKYSVGSALTFSF